MKSDLFKHFVIGTYRWQHRQLTHLDVLQTPLVLIARVYVAQIFFLSGLTKVINWDSTLFLFQEEYQVPFLPPNLAAWLGTGGELLLPIFLSLGLLGRFSAIGLFVVNLTAVLSLVEIAPAALSQHILWGVLLIVITILGVGNFSLDNWIFRRSKLSMDNH